MSEGIFNLLLDSVDICCIVFFPVLRPLACGRQSRCLGRTYKLPGGQNCFARPPTKRWPNDRQKVPQLQAGVGVSLAIYRGQKASPWKTPKKSKKGFLGPLEKRLEKESKMTIFQVFFFFFGFFARFRFVLDFFVPGMLTPGPRGPGNPFSDFFRSFSGRGLFDSCRWPTISQSGSSGLSNLENSRRLGLVCGHCFHGFPKKIARKIQENSRENGSRILKCFNKI